MIKGVQLKGVIMAIGGFAMLYFTTHKRFTKRPHGNVSKPCGL